MHLQVPAGIICLTPNNLKEPYVLFESGAILKAVDKPFVCTLLIGLEPSDVSGPLALFQATKLTKEDLLQLLQNLNKGLGQSALKDQQLNDAFEAFFPKINRPLWAAVPMPRRIAHAFWVLREWACSF
jgi:hypothetical protein